VRGVPNDRADTAHALRQRWHNATNPIAELDVIGFVWASTIGSEATLRRFTDLASRFAARLHATGVASLSDASLEDCDEFVWARTRRNHNPSMHTVHLRRSALRSLYATLEQLDPAVIDPTRHMRLPAKTGRAVRALTDDEVVLVRTAALGRQRQALRAAALVALGEATGTTTEIAQARWHHINWTAATIALTGAEPVRARTATLTNWGRQVLHRWHDHHPGDVDDFIINRRRPNMASHVAQASVTNNIIRLFDEASLRRDDIKPVSIRLWAARTILERDGIEGAARALGLTSLDATAATLEYDWRHV
jgi:site-specific recombinase XerD